jgi:hypothetical protein
MASYVRNDAWNEGGTISNPDLFWYAKGVAKMMSRTANMSTPPIRGIRLRPRFRAGAISAARRKSPRSRFRSRPPRTGSGTSASTAAGTSCPGIAVI